MADPRAGQLSPQQARHLWRLAVRRDLNELRRELAALAPGWADLTIREQRAAKGAPYGPSANSYRERD
ncbi:hypothetical protein GCM10009771_13070 [Nesterenkonia flava]